MIGAIYIAFLLGAGQWFLILILLSLYWIGGTILNTTASLIWAYKEAHPLTPTRRKLIGQVFTLVIFLPYVWIGTLILLTCIFGPLPSHH